MNIKEIRAIEILDSRGKPTLRTFVTLEDDSIHSASVPSGASTGMYEAWELRDDDKKRYLGSGVQKAINNVNTTINELLKNNAVEDIAALDKKMIAADGTENKANLGANAILSVSLALTRAAAHSSKQPLWKFINEHFFAPTKPAFPRLMVNIVNGGKHADWNFDIQEFMVIPKSPSPSQAVRLAAEIFLQLGVTLKKQHLNVLVGDEGGYSPALTSSSEVLETIIQAANEFGYKNDHDYNLALDAAASEFFKDKYYILQKNGQTLKGEELLEYYMQLEQKYKILSFEDPFAEDDWTHFTSFTQRSNNSFMVVGDDLFVTNTKRIQKGITLKAANSVLVKVNQIGSVSETIEAIKMTKAAGWKVIISHRSGETEDPFIADLAYGCGADFIKTGSMSRSERLAKYNRLIEIENGL